LSVTVAVANPKLKKVVFVTGAGPVWSGKDVGAVQNVVSRRQGLMPSKLISRSPWPIASADRLGRSLRLCGFFISILRSDFGLKMLF
jgi:hypothetical protein